MSATVRYDEQLCPIARALDQLGDRWTLLILRELVGGDRRFTDLRVNLPGIASTLLSQRLRTMTEQDLVAAVPLPPPAARSVYTITDRGRDAIPVLRALARFGMPLLEPPADPADVRPTMAANAAIRAYYDRSRAAGVHERYLLRIDGEEFAMRSVSGRPARSGAVSDVSNVGDVGEVGNVGDVGEVDLVLDATAATWLDIRQGRTTVRRALDAGRLVSSGPVTALDNFVRIFQLDRPASPDRLGA